MANDTPLLEFIVLSRGHWDANKSTEEIQSAIDDFYAWHARQVELGRLKPGQRLARPAKLVTRQRIVDGPFTEAKEVIGGYWTILARSLDEAAALAAENPCMRCGLFYEVRPVEPALCDADELTSETPPAHAASRG